MIEATKSKAIVGGVLGATGLFILLRQGKGVPGELPPGELPPGELPPSLTSADLKTPQFRFTSTADGVRAGDEISFAGSVYYKGPQNDGTLVFLLGNVLLGQVPIQEFPINLPYSAEWVNVPISGVIIVPSGLPENTAYDAFFRVLVTNEPDIQEMQTITSQFTTAPVSKIKNLKFSISGGEYNYSDKVSFNFSFDYKGIEQGALLEIAYGTGLFAIFDPVRVLQRIELLLVKSNDWEPHVGGSGDFVVPVELEIGTVYKVRATIFPKLEGESEDDVAADKVKVTGVEPVAPPEYDVQINILPDETWGWVEVQESSNAFVLKVHPTLPDTFIGWDGVDFVADPDNTVASISPKRDAVITVRFGEPVTLNIKQMGTGSIDIDPYKVGLKYAPGTEITLRAIPASGWLFMAWLDEDGDVISSEETVVITMYRNRIITAQFRSVPAELPLPSEPLPVPTCPDGYSWSPYYEECVKIPTEYA